MWLLPPLEPDSRKKARFFDSRLFLYTVAKKVKSDALFFQRPLAFDLSMKMYLLSPSRFFNRKKRLLRAKIQMV